MLHRNYTFIGTTQSLCPECLALVPAKIIVRGGRVYFKKTCADHGEREDFVCSDVKWYDRMEYAVPARVPETFGIEPDKGCPYDCGLCTEHEQHTCVGLVELTSSCNLTCPMCYASSAPGGKHLSLDAACAAIDRLVEVEGKPEILQLSGGEPTIHPQFEEILDYALSRPIDYVMINTNGIRFAKDDRLVERLAAARDRIEVYFQFDGLHDDIYLALRGERLLETKLAALEKLAAAGVHVTLVCTLQAGVNDNAPAELVEFARYRPTITGLSLQPATYSGRHVTPEELERRITFPDVIRNLASGGDFREDDFLPLPCAHPNCHQIGIAWRDGNRLLPLTQFIDAKQNLDLLANGISFTRAKSQQLMLQYLGRQGCCASGGCVPPEATAGVSLMSLGAESAPTDDADSNASPLARLADRFFNSVVGQQLGAENLFRVTITNFLDKYNFDVRRVMKCCTHHVLPSGHVIPFCAYNVLYREGHVPLPNLRPASLPLV